MIHIGPYAIQSLNTGAFALDGGAMFGIIPKPLWETRLPPDDRNRISMNLRCLLLQGAIDGAIRTILIDTGMGNKWDAKSIDIYRIDQKVPSLLDQLTALGIAADCVTDVILTHLHFDHAGGATMRTANGQIVPTFPNATYYVQAEHLAWAKNPTLKDRGSFMPHDWESLLANQQLVTIDGAQEILPHIQCYLSNGHTTAMQHPIIADDRTTLFYAADLFPTSAHLPVPWVMGYDIRPLDSITNKSHILARAVAENWIIAYEHCPLRAASRVVKTEKGFACGESVAL